MFPLHLNSFNILFVGVINPKLLKLTKSVREFIGMTCEISEFITSLEGVSTYLNNVNPAHKLLNLIKKFNGNTYLTPVKSNIDKLIGELESKYEEIIGDIRSLATSYYQLLKSEFESFKNKIEKHKKSLEQNIEKYTEKINTSLNNHSSCVQKLITKICKDINNLCRNKCKLDQFTKYSNGKMIQSCAKLNSNDDRKTYEKIFETHEKYKQCLFCYSKIKCGLNKFICELNIYHYYVCQSIKFIKKYTPQIKDTNVLYTRIYNLNYLKKLYLNKFDNYLSYVEKLEEIGGYIKTMKSLLSKVKGKVDDEAEKYIEGLDNITITASNVKSSIDNIKSVNKMIIDRLKIAWHTIDFYKSLESEIENLNGVKFETYDFTQYLTNSFQLQKKLTSFESAIKKAINKIKGEINKIENHTVVMDSNTYKESYYKNLISQVETFIDNSLNVINVIKYLLPRLENNKNQSPKISDIKCKVDEIKELKGATTNLTEAAKDLKEFVKLQESTKSLIGLFKDYGKFTSLAKYSNELQNIINESKRLIGLINYYTDYLRTIRYVDNLLTWIKKCYNKRFETIRWIIQNFKGNVNEIITRLETINKNLCQLKCDLDRCCRSYIINNNNDQCSSDNVNSMRNSVENNLWKLKDYMTYLKAYIRNSRQNFNVICGVIEKIKQDISKIDSYKNKLQSLEKYIECYIKWIEKCKKITFIVKYLVEIKDKIKEILIIKHMIFNCLNVTRIEKIQDKLIGIESTINEMECAIEGVVQNLIKSSLLSLSNQLINLKTSNNNRLIKDIGDAEVDDPVMSMYSLMSVMDYRG